MERLIDVLQTGINEIEALNQAFDLDLLQSRITSICRKIKTLSHPRYAEETRLLQQLLSYLQQMSGNMKREKQPGVFFKARREALCVLEAVLEMED